MDTSFPQEAIDQWAAEGRCLSAEFTAGELVARTGLHIVEATPQHAYGTLPVKGNTQPYGLLHGGASAVLAETLGSAAAALHAGPMRRAVGMELNCSHHHSVRTGTVTGVATAAHLGSTTATYSITITDESGRTVCTARLTCHLAELRADDTP